MNAKRAKAHRKLARELTSGNPDRAPGLDRKTGCAMNHPKTTRGVYRILRRGKA